MIYDIKNVPLHWYSNYILVQNDIWIFPLMLYFEN